MHNDFSGTGTGTVVQAGSINQLHLHPPLSSPAAVPRQLPAALPVFVNQTDAIATLDASSGSGARLIALTGMGGVGKTSLAIHWLTQHAGQFPDGQLYAMLGGDANLPPADPYDLAAAFLRAFGIEGGRIPISPSERFALWRSVIHGRRVAILLDGAVTAKQVLPLLPAGPGPMVVVTSTQDLTGPLLEYGEAIDLAPWPERESRALLESLATRTVALGPAADSLLEACGGLPLAIGITAGRVNALSRKGRPVAKLARDLADHRRRLGALSDESRSITGVIDRSYRTLSPTAAELHQAMGRLPLHHVPTLLAAAALRIELEQAETTLDELADAHLVELSGPELYRQHDLVRLHAQTQTNEEDAMTYLDQLRGVADGLLAPLRQSDVILCPTHPDRIPTPDAFTLPEPLCPQIETTEQAAAWCTAHTEYVVQIMIACSEAGEHSRVVQFAHLAWPLSHLYGLPRLPIVDLGRASARKLGDLRAEAMMETGRDGPLSQLARYDEAIEATNRAAEIYEEIGDVRGQGQATHSRARVVCLKVDRAADKQAAWGELVQASADVETARALFAKVRYRRGEALCMITAGRIAETLGDFERALEMFETAKTTLIEGLPAENEPADPYDGAVAALGAARIHIMLGYAQEARSRLGLAEELMGQLRTEKGLGLVAETTGRVLITAGDHAGALAAYQRARIYFEATDAYGLARVTEQIDRLSAA